MTAGASSDSGSATDGVLSRLVGELEELVHGAPFVASPAGTDERELVGTESLACDLLGWSTGEVAHRREQNATDRAVVVSSAGEAEDGRNAERVVLPVVFLPVQHRSPVIVHRDHGKRGPR